MMDYCTKSATEAEFNALMLECGLFVDVNGVVGPVLFTMSLDRIGPITLADGTVYPEYYTNIRITTGLTDEQQAALNSISIDPAQPQYRQWAQ